MGAEDPLGASHSNNYNDIHHLIIQQPALMIYGDRDVIPKSPNLTTFVPNVDVVSLDCGHNIQQEKPQETNQAILRWLEWQAAS